MRHLDLGQGNLGIETVLKALGAEELASVVDQDEGSNDRHVMVATDRGLIDLSVSVAAESARGSLTPWAEVTGVRTDWTVTSSTEPRITFRIGDRAIREPNQQAAREAWSDFVHAVGNQLTRRV
jgi:hypothetical protein